MVTIISHNSVNTQTWSQLWSEGLFTPEANHTLSNVWLAKMCAFPLVMVINLMTCHYCSPLCLLSQRSVLGVLTKCIRFWVFQFLPQTEQRPFSESVGSHAGIIVQPLCFNVSVCCCTRRRVDNVSNTRCMFVFYRCYISAERYLCASCLENKYFSPVWAHPISCCVTSILKS